MANKGNTLAIAGLLLTALAALVAVPSVAAHDCSSTTPDGCGECDNTETHHHYVSYTGKTAQWCTFEKPSGCIRALDLCYGDSQSFRLYATPAGL